MTAHSVIIDTTDDDTIRVYAPYSKEFPKLARAAGGDFERGDKSWVFPAVATRRVYEILANVYGWTGQVAQGMPATAIRLTLLEAQTPQYGQPNEILYAGKLPICEAVSRDGGVRFKHGVRHAGGELPRSGGSMKYPRVLVAAGLVVETEVDIGVMEGLDVKVWRLDVL